MKQNCPTPISRKIKIFSWMSVVLAGSAAWSETSLAHTALNPARVLEFSISKGGLTRISIDNDGIEDIYAYPTEYAENISHHKSGHIFVVTDDLEGPFYVTLITTRGIAQDLKLIPRSKRTEPILLKAEDTPAESASREQERSTALLTSFIGGIVPAGFFVATPNEVSRGTGEAAAVLEKAYQNDIYRVLAFNIKNTHSERITLDNRVFWEKGDLASAFDRSALNPEESAKLYVIQLHSQKETATNDENELNP